MNRRGLCPTPDDSIIPRNALKVELHDTTDSSVRPKRLQVSLSPLREYYQRHNPPRPRQSQRKDIKMAADTYTLKWGIMATGWIAES